MYFKRKSGRKRGKGYVRKKKIKAIRVCLGFNDDCRIKLQSSDKERTKQIRKTIYQFINENKYTLFPSCMFITDDLNVNKLFYKQHIK